MVDGVEYRNFIKTSCLEKGFFDYRGKPSMRIHKVDFGDLKWAIEYDSNITGVDNEYYKTLDEAIYDFCHIVFRDYGVSVG